MLAADTAGKERSRPSFVGEEDVGTNISVKIGFEKEGLEGV